MPKASYGCSECGLYFSTKVQLIRHSGGTGHSAYKCPFPECDATFTRQDAMFRHQLIHEQEDNVKYPCTHRRKWSAPNGFLRKDHLKQHLKNYHHIECSEDRSRWQSTYDIGPTSAAFFLYCPHQDCSLFRAPKDNNERNVIRREHLFKSRSDYTTHLRKEHDDSSFPCNIRGCKRIGGKVYFRKRDLLKHLAKEHPDPESQAAAPGDEFDIEVDGCAEEV